MTGFGFRARNANNAITIDDALQSYVYVGAWRIPSQSGPWQDIDFTCAGFPLIFFSVPYNVTAQDLGAPDSRERYMSRTGVAMVKLVSTGANAWRATFIVNNYNGPDLGLYMRVFGKIHPNFPAAYTNTHGFRTRNAAGQILFDSNMPMLRLGTSTYDAEIRLDPMTPGGTSTTKAADLFDSYVDIGTNMSGMSVCATTRGMIHYPFSVGGGFYDVHKFVSLYWANGNRLYARRISIGYDRLQVANGYGFDGSQYQTVYSRVSVLRNSQWPALADEGISGAPQITAHPVNTADLADGQIATFLVTATGDATLTYQWKLNGVAIAGATVATYSFTIGATHHTGDEYTCTVSNAKGMVTSLGAILTMHHAVPGPAPTINGGPYSVNVYQFVGASMTVNASPVDGYQWYKDGAMITGATGSSIGLNTDTIGTFTYKVRCYNNGLYTEASATLTVSVDNTPPTIVSGPASLNVVQNGGAYMQVNATGATAYQWYQDGQPVSGATTSGYYGDTSVVGTHAIMIRCYKNGNYADASCTLTVTAPTGGGGTPGVDTQPVGASVQVGDLLNLSFVAHPVDYYRWFRNGVEISGDYNSTIGVYTGDVGTFNYKAIAVNGAYTTESNTVQVIITAASGNNNPFVNYQNMPYQEDIEYDTTAQYIVLDSDPWHIGPGDATLYDVMATPIGTSDQLTGDTQQFNVWYSFASHSAVMWKLRQPTNSMSGHLTVSDFTVSIRLRSTGEIVSTGSGHLESINS